MPVAKKHVAADVNHGNRLGLLHERSQAEELSRQNRFAPKAATSAPCRVQRRSASTRVSQCSAQPSGP